MDLLSSFLTVQDPPNGPGRNASVLEDGADATVEDPGAVQPYDHLFARRIHLCLHVQLTTPGGDDTTDAMFRHRWREGATARS
jgi:hypothetical protein